MILKNIKIKKRHLSKHALGSEHGRRGGPRPNASERRGQRGPGGCRAQIIVSVADTHTPFLPSRAEQCRVALVRQATMPGPVILHASSEI